MADGEHAFDLATAVRGGPGSWKATVDPGWTVGDRPNGGYLLALAVRAALGVVDQPHPLAVSGQFLAPPAVGPAELKVVPLRAGRTLSTARVTLVQDGRPLLEALVSAGQLAADGAPEWQRASRPPDLPPVDECLRGQPDVPGRVRVNILDHLDIRLDPATAGSFLGRPSGRLEMRGWADRLPPWPAGARLAGLRAPRSALAGRLVRRGRRGVGRQRPPGRPGPPARRRPAAGLAVGHVHRRSRGTAECATG